LVAGISGGAMLSARKRSRGVAARVLTTGELAAERERESARIVDDDLQEPEERRVPVLEVRVDIRIVAAGRERVLGQIIRTDGEEIDVPHDRRDRQGGGRRLDHRAESRAASDPEGDAGLLEELPRRADVVFERDHGHEHAHFLRARQTDERRELGPEQCRVPQQEPYAAEAERWFASLGGCRNGSGLSPPTSRRRIVSGLFRSGDVIASTSS